MIRKVIRRGDEMFEQLVAQYSYDGLCVIDANGTWLYMNPSAAKILGAPAKKFIGKNVKDAIKVGDISESVALKVIREKRIVTDVVIINGKEVLSTGIPVFNGDEELCQVVLNVRDINELNNLKIDELLSIALKNKPILYEELLNDDLLPDTTNIVAKSRAFREVLKVILRIAKVDSTVYLQGESGVGKEVIVNLLHENSKRRKMPLVKVNCSAIPAHLLESELFGYEKGAFTGADQRGKPGLFEQANGGTILLDEIGDMPLDLQAKILRVLQEHEIMRIGGRESIKLDVRIVSATNKNLDKLVKEGKFRLDLFYRLNIVPIVVPPLRERQEDILPLAQHFLHKKNNKYGLKVRFSPGVIHLFKDYDWPGNVREMENMIERLVVMAEHEEITWGDLPFIQQASSPSLQQPLKALLIEIEKKIIQEKLRQYKTTRKTAEALGISQSALVKKLQKYNE